MEKEIYQKYYDTIVGLVKDHKKYAGLEAILDDIVEDVINHSKVVIGTVNNDDVVISYLKKVVSTSIITVPQKLNIETSNRRKHSIQSITISRSVEEDESFEEELLELAQSKEDEESNLDQIYEKQVEESIEELIEENLVIENSAVDDDISIPDVNASDEDGVSYTVDDTELVDMSNEEEIISANEEGFVNVELVDKMINGVVKEENDIDEDLVSPELEEDVAPVDNEFSEDLEVLNDVENLATAENIEQEYNDFEISKEETLDDAVSDYDIETLESTEDEDLGIEVSEYVTENVETDGFVQESDGLLELEETAEFLTPDFEEDNESLIELDSDCNNVEDAITIDVEEGTDTSAEVSLGSVENMYSCFDFEPEQFEVDNYTGEEIAEILAEIDRKRPEFKIFKVFEMKYSKGLTVQEIASELNFEQSNVIEILNEIVDEIKD